MTGFVKNRIVNSQTLGDRLAEARNEKNISLEKAAKELKIAYKYLAALEENKLQDIPGRAYLKNFLRLYCAYLDLNFNDSWQLAKELEAHQTVRRLGIDRRHLFLWPKFIKRTLIILAVVAILAFLLFKVQEIFTPPALKIIEPTDGSIVAARQIKIIGSSEPEVEIVINNRLIFVDNRGKFESDLDLQKGLNLIKITSKKRYSLSQEAVVRVLLNETPAP